TDARRGRPDAVDRTEERPAPVVGDGAVRLRVPVRKRVGHDRGRTEPAHDLVTVALLDPDRVAVAGRVVEHTLLRGGEPEDAGLEERQRARTRLGQVPDDAARGAANLAPV